MCLPERVVVTGVEPHECLGELETWDLVSKTGSFDVTAGAGEGFCEEIISFGFGVKCRLFLRTTALLSVSTK